MVGLHIEWRVNAEWLIGFREESSGLPNVPALRPERDEYTESRFPLPTAGILCNKVGWIGETPQKFARHGGYARCVIAERFQPRPVGVLLLLFVFFSPIGYNVAANFHSGEELELTCQGVSGSYFLTATK